MDANVRLVTRWITGKLNKDMYQQIGRVYKSVEEKELWCENAKPVSEIGVFTAEEFYATGVAGQIPGASEGVARLLMEYGYQFDLLTVLLILENTGC